MYCCFIAVVFIWIFGYDNIYRINIVLLDGYTNLGLMLSQSICRNNKFGYVLQKFWVYLKNNMYILTNPLHLLEQRIFFAVILNLGLIYESFLNFIYWVMLVVICQYLVIVKTFSAKLFVLNFIFQSRK